MAWNIIANLPGKGGKNSLCLFAFAIQLGPGNCQRRLRQGVSCGISHFSNSDASAKAMSYLTDKTAWRVFQYVCIWSQQNFTRKGALWHSLYHVQMLNTSVEVVHAVILAEGYCGSSQEVEAVANPGCKGKWKIVKIFLPPLTPLFWAPQQRTLCCRCCWYCCLSVSASDRRI